MATRTYSLKVAPSAPPPLRIDYAALLNPEQLRAVEAPEAPALVIAGAGSGKTRTLTFRVARLLERGVPPEGILLLTFTNKAAREMTRRVEQLAGGFVDVRRILGGTFHHAAHALLRQHAGALGFSTGFGVLDREDARDLMAACVGALQRPRGAPRFPKPEVVLDLVSSAINLQRPLAQLIVDKRPQFLPVADELLAAAVRFQQRKAQMGLMDFDDLLMHLKRLLVEHPRVRAQLNERFRCVLVDEYQDTNRLQGDIVDLLVEERKSLTVVGDDCQSIYSFRGADFTNIMEFPQRYPGCGVYPLTRNYRSTPQILRLANASIALNRRQFPKELRAERPAGLAPVVVPARDVEEQAAFVAQRVLELREEGMPLEEMAVLYRAHHHSMELQVELARRGIPFRVRSGVRFFEQAHIKDVLAHLRMVHNPLDELAFRRVVKLVPGVGPASAESLWTAVSSLPPVLALADALAHPLVAREVPRKGTAGYARLCERFAKLGAPGAQEHPGQLILDVLEGGYADYLKQELGADERRADDVRQLAEYAGRAASLQAFLEDIALVAELAAEEGGSPGEPPDELLTLSSVHQAKGLEWRAVFVIWMADGRFPLAAASRQPEDEEEERRLFYVACTRAKDELALVYPLMAAPQERERVILRVSRFIEELPGGEGEEDAPYDRLLLEPVAVEDPHALPRLAPGKGPGPDVPF
ncbi:ATP-dependent helicase [Aggregicoccus sp. 17bor-14]|uniref:ATP-dependent helicase n=1 Tax=Myxococcaceae TaxID=31 RepID=UPI00129CAC57|nr:MULTISPECIES: ATP-dependent helicase [Myxococcaceae]MBF5043995.1 ATP-dependent helicase [Simulacricoccus sp. 17bor-14]MRI89746.1 ATP-dependent helicase [Aggregicoccus sp. 17bor-14]